MLHGEADVPRGTATCGRPTPEKRKREERSGRGKPLSLDRNPPSTTHCLTEVTECNLQPVHDLLVFISTHKSFCLLVLPIFYLSPAG